MLEVIMTQQALHHFVRLDERMLFNILRGMLEGKFSLKSILNAIEHNQLYILDILDEQMNYMVESVGQSSNNQSLAKYHLDQYRNLPIWERLSQKDFFSSQLSNFVRIEDDVFHNFKKIVDSDITILSAIDIFVSTFIFSVYKISNVSTKNGQIPALKLMHPSYHHKMADLQNELKSIIQKFRMTFTQLMNCNISPDVKEFLMAKTGNLIHIEMDNWTPINKTMHFLYFLNDALRTTTLKDRPIFGAPTTPQSIIQLRRILGGLSTDETELLYCCCSLADRHSKGCQSQISSVFNQVRNHIENEIKSISGSFFKNKSLLEFYHTWKAQIDAILKDAAEEQNAFVTDLIASRDQERQGPYQTNTLEYMMEKDKRFISLQPFIYLHMQLESKIRELNCDDVNLIQHLKNEKDKYLNLDINIATFKSNCNALIATALRSDLAKQPKLVELLYDIAFAVVSLFTAGGANLFSYVKTGSFRFFVVPPTELNTMMNHLNTNIECLS